MDSATGRRQVVLLMFLAAVVLFNQVENVSLHSVDGIVYAVIGKELALKPLSEWAVLTWHGAPFYEHPHLTLWILGAFMKVFGISTLTAVLPVVILSWVTVYLAYLLGRELLDHRLGLIAGTVLTLTPVFVKLGRNPMLEPALMFFLMLTLLLHLRSARGGDWRLSLLTGTALGLAFLAKGPPAVLALGVIGAFQASALVWPSAFRPFVMRPARAAGHLAIGVAIAAALVGAVDLWHVSLAGKSFFGHYFAHQLGFTVLEGRGAMRNDLGFYWKVFFQYWPWWPVVLLGPALVAWKRDREAAPAALFGALVTFGTIAGFTLIRHKSDWYIAIHFVASSILAALALRYVLTERRMASGFGRFCLILGVPVIFLSASFPSLFTHYGRPIQEFLESGSSALGKKLAGARVADCIRIEDWKGPFYFSFYFDAKRVKCDDPAARYKTVDLRSYRFRSGERALFARQPFALVETGAK